MASFADVAARFLILAARSGRTMAERWQADQRALHEARARALAEKPDEAGTEGDERVLTLIRASQALQHAHERYAAAAERLAAHFALQAAAAESAPAPAIPPGDYPARCIACQHRWTTRLPDGITVGVLLECPECGIAAGRLE